MFFCIPYVLSRSVFDGTGIALLWSNYETVFLTTRNFVFRGFWILLGMMICRYLVIEKLKNLKINSVVFLLGSFLALYVIYDMLPESARWLLPIFIILYMFAWFNLFCNIRMGCNTLKLRKSSVIMFYVHYLMIFAIKFIAVILNIEINSCGIFIVAVALCIIISIVLMKINNMKLNRIVSI